MNGTRCEKCGVDASYVRQRDRAHVCKKCGHSWPIEEVPEDAYKVAKV